METCKNCKNWKMNNTERNKCYHRGMKFGRCTSDIFKYVGDTGPNSKSRFIYCDAECYGATFQTHADFGCVGFTPIRKMQELNQLS